jgi:hypothetical protein
MTPESKITMPLPLQCSTTHDLVKASLEVDRLEDELKDAKKKREYLAQLVADEYQAGDIRNQSVTVDGKKFTVYRRRDCYANVPAANRERVVEVIRTMGMDDMIKTAVSTSSLKAWMVEQARGDDPSDPYDWDAVPQELRELVTVGETVKAVVKRG